MAAQSELKTMASAIRGARNPGLYDEDKCKVVIDTLNAGMSSVPYSSILAQDRRKAAEGIKKWLDSVGF